MVHRVRRFGIIAAALSSVVSGRTYALEPLPSPSIDGPERVPGHSTHGLVFNEGPRQRAYLMKGMPNVHFPVSCKGPDLQKFFDQGIGQVHGFWVFEAERSFRQVTAIAPGCAMAYLGMALSNLSNDLRARLFMAKAMSLKDTADDRERRWIEALANFFEVTREDAEKATKLDPRVVKPDGKLGAVVYKDSAKDRYKKLIVALENIAYAYPDDIEAKAFTVLFTWDASAKFWRYFDTDMVSTPLSSESAVDALAHQVLDKNPMHPLHHYLIHLWDGPRAERALPSAFRSGQSGPGIAHLWHMAGHTFAKVNRHQDAVYQQEASARVDHAQMLRDNIFPDQIHNYGHNNDWLVQSLSYVGRVHDALALARNLIDIPRHPRWNGVTAPGSKGQAFANANEKRENSAWFGRQKLLDLLVRFELWEQIVALKDTQYLEATDLPEEQAKRLRALGLAYFALGRVAEGRRIRGELRATVARQKEQRQRIFDGSASKARGEKLSEDLVMKAVSAAVDQVTAAIKRSETMLVELDVWLRLAESKPVAPDALEAVKDLAKPRLAQLYFRIGQHEKALALAKAGAQDAINQTQPLANWADLLWRSGHAQEAQSAFGTLRPLSSRLDLDVPVFSRLKPIARSLGLPADWRQPYQAPPDLALPRPSLDSLGPPFWSPPKAPGFRLPDSQGRTVSLSQYRGRWVVVIFYLGYGCIHCLEQLAAFAPMTEKFNKAGVSLVAISLDSVEGLKKTISGADTKAGLTFPLLSDESLRAFQGWRAYDGFENIPLHGTFLIDGAGRVRWHDISYEPFLEADFLLREAKRLKAVSP